MDDASCRVKVRFVDDVRHHSGEGDWQFTRLRYAETESQRVLCVCVQTKDAFALSGKLRAEACGDHCLADNAFHVGDRNCFAHTVYLLFSEVNFFALILRSMFQE